MAESHKMVRVPVSTWVKLKYLAGRDRRTLGSEMDVLLDDVLFRRGIDLDEIPGS